MAGIEISAHGLKSWVPLDQVEIEIADGEGVCMCGARATHETKSEPRAVYCEAHANDHYRRGMCRPIQR